MYECMGTFADGVTIICVWGGSCRAGKLIYIRRPEPSLSFLFSKLTLARGNLNKFPRDLKSNRTQIESDFELFLHSIFYSLFTLLPAFLRDNSNEKNYAGESFFRGD